MDAVRTRACITGAVQGVGFRPFVYRVATEQGLAGYVTNTPSGVELEVEGPPEKVEAFFKAVQESPPPLSIIEEVQRETVAAKKEQHFTIRQSVATGEVSANVLPDIATCPECLREMRDANDRRYRYPFTNCTHCGPRFSILARLPYDRPNTSMQGFAMCSLCRAEYEDPGDRRFHAQPTACPECGPQLALWDGSKRVLEERDAALIEAAEAVRNGKVVAIKGLGGFHLVVDARDEDAVNRLRQHKNREEKPFALMYRSIEAVRRDCRVSKLEERLLASPEAPIVLLRRKEDTPGVAEAVAPDVPRLGAMLPCTPLHHLLLEALDFPIVATSGNLSEEPICIDEHEAVQRLEGIADCLLVHDRPILRHVDDSIVQVAAGREMVLRRARGYAPLPIDLGEEGPSACAVGAHLKNTVALTKGRRAYLSQHIGDLDTPRALDAFCEASEALRRLYEIQPVAVAADLHPDYVSTKQAAATDLPCHGVQHHYAHVLACMAEHGIDRPVLGIAWDGTGYGADGAIWGGEFLRATREDFQRLASLRPFPLPGGERAIREPRRSALGLLYACYGPETFEMKDVMQVLDIEEKEQTTLAGMLERDVNCPRTSSVGRLFDAVAALRGLHLRCSYEGQAAMALEYAARRHGRLGHPYSLPLRRFDQEWLLDWAPMVDALLWDAGEGSSIQWVAAAFHAGLVHAIVAVARKARLHDVVLSGGCFQNTLLTEQVILRLRSAGFTVHWHHRVPPNDGGIALGQALYAVHRAAREKNLEGTD